MEAIKALAWHLVHNCDEICLYHKLVGIQPKDRRKIIQAINWGLKQRKQEKTVLTKEHLQIISSILVHGSVEEIDKFRFELIMYIFAFGMKKMEIQLESLFNQE